jgi:glycosyltransferase involved in cell wall biosynthesis
MKKNFKISVITPSFNSAQFIREAIISVIKQDYPNFEHIIVDGGSTDGTLNIIRQFDHIIWVSEPDRGQSDAMNKGFRMSTGDLIVYLNADDFFSPDAFKRVVPYFESNAKFVIGKVRIDKDDGTSWINDPKITHDEMLRHWESNAYCVNPVGYFYLREVQENVADFNINNHIAMDLEFLLDCSRKFQFTKMSEEEVLGVFRRHGETKTALSNKDIAKLFSFSTFNFIDKFLEGRPPDFIRTYNIQRMEGYTNRIKSFRSKEAGELCKNRPSSRSFKIMYRKLIDFRKSANKLEIIRQFIRGKLKLH